MVHPSSGRGDGQDRGQEAGELCLREVSGAPADKSAASGLNLYR